VFIGAALHCRGTPAGEGEAKVVMLEPPLPHDQAKGVQIVMLDLPLLGDKLVSRYAQRSFAISEPSELASQMLARMCVQGCAPVFQHAPPRSSAVPSYDAARAPFSAGKSVAPAPTDGQTGSATSSLHQPMQQVTCLKDVFANDAVVAARDGSGVVWACLFQSTQRMMKASLIPAGMFVSTFYVLELMPTQTLSSTELQAARQVFGGRLVLSAEKIGQAVQQGLQDAGARAALYRKSANSGACTAAQQCLIAAEGIKSLVRRMRGGIDIAQAIEGNALWELQPFKPTQSSKPP
jgi:hypothetical protein